jgi:hypothetical protein
MLPYGLAFSHIKSAVQQTEEYFIQMNKAAIDIGCPAITEILAANAISGFVSDLMIAGICKACPSLIKNEKTGGYPDMLPTADYPSSFVQKGETGIEVKSSKRKNGWIGHNPESGWFLTIKYKNIVETKCIVIEQVLLAHLSLGDWSFSPRKENSRRTPTASINKCGVSKLMENIVYDTEVVYELERRLDQAGKIQDSFTESFGISDLVS